MQNQIQFTGLICDNTNCDYRDSSVDFHDLRNHINRPCPKCGENLLTEDDCARAEDAMKMVDFVNNLSEQEINEILKSLGVDPDNVPDELYNITINTYKELKIDIKKVDE